jgi:hypothetical protein
MDKLISLKKLLWTDGIAALLAGIILLIFSSRLSVFFNLPESLVKTQGIINLLYCSYSLSLARRTVNSKRSIYILALANAAYALFGICLLLYFFKTASLYGIVYLIAEVLFIGLLSVLERKKNKPHGGR